MSEETGQKFYLETQTLRHLMDACPERLLSGLNRQVRISQLCVQFYSQINQGKGEIEICDDCIQSVFDNCTVQEEGFKLFLDFSSCETKGFQCSFRSKTLDNFLISNKLKDIDISFLRISPRVIRQIFSHYSKSILCVSTLSITLGECQRITQGPSSCMLACLPNFVDLNSLSLNLNRLNLSPNQMVLFCNKDLHYIPKHLKKLFIQSENNINIPESCQKMLENIFNRIPLREIEVFKFHASLQSYGENVFASLAKHFSLDSKLQTIDIQLTQTKLHQNLFILLKVLLEGSELKNVNISLIRCSNFKDTAILMFKLVERKQNPIETLNFNISHSYLNNYEDQINYYFKHLWNSLIKHSESLKSIQICLEQFVVPLKNEENFFSYLFSNYFEGTNFPLLTSFILKGKMIFILIIFLFLISFFIYQKDCFNQDQSCISELNKKPKFNLSLIQFINANTQLQTLYIGGFPMQKEHYFDLTKALQKCNQLNNLKLNFLYERNIQLDIDEESLKIFDGLHHLNLKKVTVETNHIQLYQQLFKLKNIEEFYVDNKEGVLIEFGKLIQTCQVQKMTVNRRSISDVNCSTKWDQFSTKIIIFNKPSTNIEFIPCFVQSNFERNKLLSQFTIRTIQCIAFSRSIEAYLNLNPKYVQTELYY